MTNVLLSQVEPTQNPTVQDKIDIPAVVIGLAILVLGLIVLGIVYWYLGKWRDVTENLTREILKDIGQLPALQEASAGVELRTGDLSAAGRRAELRIFGPSAVSIGSSSANFKAELDGQPRSVTWSFSGPAEVGSSTGSETTLTGKSPGSGRLEARDGATSVTLAVEIVDRTTKVPAGKIPFVGAGYGGVTVTILAVTVAGCLTAIGLLPGAALATLLGTVVSYFFAQRGGAGSSTDVRDA